MMSERIAALAQKTVIGEMYVYPVKTEYDRMDWFLSEVKRIAKRVCEYILNQEPLITENSCFTGLIKFDGSVEGDIFHRRGYPHFDQLRKHFYNRPIDNLLTFEWQHSVGDFGKIISHGLTGIKADIEQSKQAHVGEEAALEFLDTQTDFCNTVIAYANKCAEKVSAFSEGVVSAEKKANLQRLATSLKKVPEMPAESFYEAVLSLYFVYGYIPDSIGLIDRYLYPYYQKDINSGKITREEAKEYLQELFLMLQARISMEDLCRALDSNWQGYEDERTLILKRAKFFGNDEELSDDIARRLFSIFNEWNDGNNYLGKKWVFGNLIGYNEHNKFFGNAMKATPDGRYAADAISFGIGQSDGKDRNGISALLNSVAKCDPDVVLTGPSVTNVLIDEKLVSVDENFEKLVSLFETYFQNGGTHFQLSYVSKEDLIAAKADPEKYKHLRVRVSGFSDYFIFLNDALQDEILQRTQHAR